VTDAHRPIEQRLAETVWPDRCFVWHDGTRFVLSIVRPERGIVSYEYGRFLSKADLFKLASLEDGVDTGRYVHNLLRVIENQTKEINRLRSKHVGPEGALRSMCPECGYTYGTHQGLCSYATPDNTLGPSRVIRDGNL
jgi:hypothetical protein